jgi:hypothetical protein
MQVLHTTVPEDLLGFVLNGATVGLCIRQRGAAEGAQSACAMNIVNRAETCIPTHFKPLVFDNVVSEVKKCFCPPMIDADASRGTDASYITCMHFAYDEGCFLVTGSLDTTCLGVGIVRAVDMAKRCLYVLTPLSLERLQQVDTVQVHPIGVHMTIV